MWTWSHRQEAGFFIRRMVHETAVHRWDAEGAAGTTSPIDPPLASDGIDEYFELAVPRLGAREGIEIPTRSLHVHCTDVDGEWLAWSDGDGYHLIRAHQKGDAVVRGPAEVILLLLWGRKPNRSDELEHFGDEDALGAWLAMAGM